MVIGLNGFVKPSGYMILNSEFTVEAPITQAVMTMDLSGLLANTELTNLIDFKEEDIKLYINEEEISVFLEDHKLSLEGWTHLGEEVFKEATYKIKMHIPTKIKKATYSTKQYDKLVKSGRQFPLKLEIISQASENTGPCLEKTYGIKPYKMPRIN